MQEDVGPSPGRHLHELAVVGPGLLRLRRRRSTNIHTATARAGFASARRSVTRKSTTFECFQRMEPDGSCHGSPVDPVNVRSRDGANCPLEDALAKSLLTFAQAHLLPEVCTVISCRPRSWAMARPMRAAP